MYIDYSKEPVLPIPIPKKILKPKGERFSESPAIIDPKKEISRTRNLEQQTLREKRTELLNKLWLGNWSAEDELTLRKTQDELKKRGSGAYDDKVYSAISEDGLKFTKENKVCVYAISAHEAVIAADGTVKIISCGQDINSIISRRGVTGKLDLHVSKDGIIFKVEDRFRIIDLYVKGAIDPDIVLLPNGNLRIYYLCPCSWQWQRGMEGG